MPATAPGFHDYEIVLPYGDAVDFQGLEVNAAARMETPPAAPAVRYVAYGDSVTHGFTASAIDKTYPYLVAHKMGWQLINLGLGGRSSNVSDAHVLKTLKADVITVLMGVNDWQGGAPLERYRKNMNGFFDALRAVQPAVPIYFITSLWVPPRLEPQEPDRRPRSLPPGRPRNRPRPQRRQPPPHRRPRPHRPRSQVV